MAASCCIGGWALPSRLSTKGLRDLLWSVLLPQAPTPLRPASGKGAIEHGELRMATPTYSEWMAGAPITVLYPAGRVQFFVERNGALHIECPEDFAISTAQLQRVRELLEQPTRTIYDLILRSMQ